MLQFSKYQGLGNDFLIVEGRQGQLPEAVSDPDADWVRRICDRRFGVGGDGLILALPPQGEGDLRMRIMNADGSEAEMCGKESVASLATWPTPMVMAPDVSGRLKPSRE